MIACLTPVAQISQFEFTGQGGSGLNQQLGISRKKA